MLLGRLLGGYDNPEVQGIDNLELIEDIVALLACLYGGCKNAPKPIHQGFRSRLENRAEIAKFAARAPRPSACQILELLELALLTEYPMQSFAYLDLQYVCELYTDNLFEVMRRSFPGKLWNASQPERALYNLPSLLLNHLHGTSRDADLDTCIRIAADEMESMIKIYGQRASSGFTDTVSHLNEMATSSSPVSSHGTTNESTEVGKQEQRQEEGVAHEAGCGDFARVPEGMDEHRKDKGFFIRKATFQTHTSTTTNDHANENLVGEICVSAEPERLVCLASKCACDDYIKKISPTIRGLIGRTIMPDKAPEVGWWKQGTNGLVIWQSGEKPVEKIFKGPEGTYVDVSTALANLGLGL